MPFFALEWLEKPAIWSDMAKPYKDYLGESHTRSEHTIPHRSKFANTSFLSKWQNCILQQASSAHEARGAAQAASVTLFYCTVCPCLCPAVWFGQLFFNPLTWAFIQHNTKVHSSCYFKAKYNDSNGLHLYLALELLLLKSGLDKPYTEHTMLIKHLHTLRFFWSFSKHQIHQDQSVFPSKAQSLSPHCSWHSQPEAHCKGISPCLLSSLLPLTPGKKLTLADRAARTIITSVRESTVLCFPISIMKEL